MDYKDNLKIITIDVNRDSTIDLTDCMCILDIKNFVKGCFYITLRIIYTFETKFTNVIHII